ncbi:hypothetical protein [Actinomadura rugatobispora]|uniref:Uncharacterized protein n=1 Tax=Actinomadura rugatobispora TaxID=1994 RepID=A0ABW1A2D3_9ACTN|nr:hypothetical protein GCM10010200_052590 [Actinomadura rugatobispora]
MTDDYDAPLDGDIGPAPTVGATRPAPAEDLAHQEREREERRRRTNAVSGRLALAAVALLLAFLAYDSVTTALEARRRDDPWIYPPAVIAALCLAGLAVIAVWTLRRRK